MQTLYDFGMEIQKIREAADSLTVKGCQNATLIVYITNKCNDIIRAINDMGQHVQSPPPGQNADVQTSKKEGGINGEPNPGITP